MSQASNTSKHSLQGLHSSLQGFHSTSSPKGLHCVSQGLHFSSQGLHSSLQGLHSSLQELQSSGLAGERKGEQVASHCKNEKIQRSTTQSHAKIQVRGFPERRISAPAQDGRGGNDFENCWRSRRLLRTRALVPAVSYTHLTLPTKA